MAFDPRPEQRAGPNCGPLPVRRAAPAKVNLYLHVIGRRPDGYHLLDSLMAFVGVFDTLAVRPSDELALTLDGPFAKALDGGPGNLVLKAARALAEACGIRAGADIQLTKRLPVASGLGGGSADAAAALRALGRLWGVSLPPSDLDALALSLGADVPFCLAGETAYIGGVGEEVTPAPPLPPAWVVLVNPLEPLSTPAVFAARGGAFSEPARIDGAPEDVKELAALLKHRRNDLTQAAVALMPRIGDILAALADVPGCLLARMSGSGATCFALFAAEAEARRGASRLAATQPGWWAVAAPLLSGTRELAPGA